MDAAEYDAWYRSARGSWIGQIEYELLHAALKPHPGESLVDIGCGTGYFSRRFTRDGHAATGIDVDPTVVDFAREHAAGGDEYLCADARRLPFPDRAFDLSISVTALCFIHDQRTALAEMLRVSRRRFAVGLLNRHSLLYLEKGRNGRGGYRGAHWHTEREVRSLLDDLAVHDYVMRSAILLPSGGAVARAMESCLSNRVPFGAFLVAAGRVPRN
jgi:ubiquinone/menaquinone biosynthesis C-methylase UbiE